MQKIKIRLPATLTHFGPGLGSLGLALSLYTHVEISPSSDQSLVVETEGEGAGRYPIGLRHPVVLALLRVFQKLECAPLGIHIKVDNQIPLNSGLGAEPAFMAAGVIGANNLMKNLYSREDIITLAAQISQKPNSAITSILGGLTAGVIDDDNVIYRTLPLEPFKLLIAVPLLEDYKPPVIPERVRLDDTLYNLSHLPLLIEALRTGDRGLLSQMIDDRLQTPIISKQITGYAHIAEVARLAGAHAVTTSGDGPAMVILGRESDYDRIAEVIEIAFENLDIPARIWTLPIDTQGVVISVMQTA